jgi:hypothetical protein
MSNVWKGNEDLNKSYDPSDIYQMQNMRRDDIVSKSLSSTSNLSQAKSKLYTRMVDKLSEKFGNNATGVIK